MIERIRTAPCRVCSGGRSVLNRKGKGKQAAGCPVCAGSGRIILPPGAIRCSVCHAQGYRRLTSHGGNICGTCGGLGILMF